LHLTLKQASRDIFSFSFLFFFILITFISLFYLLFHAHVIQCSTWVRTAQVCFQMAALHFSSTNDLKTVNPFVTALCLFLFLFFVVFLFGNVFISIIVDNFRLVRRRELARPNEYEIITFLTGKFRQWFGEFKYKFN
jgi:hypothetical protein